jgi:hypothetical protein
MRDFHDIYAFANSQSHNIDMAVLKSAFENTSRKRGSFALINEARLILDEIETSERMKALWESYGRKFDYASGINWIEAMQSAKRLITSVADE